MLGRARPQHPEQRKGEKDVKRKREQEEEEDWEQEGTREKESAAGEAFCAREEDVAVLGPPS